MSSSTITYIRPLTGSRFERTSCRHRPLDAGKLRRNRQRNVDERQRRNLLRLPVVEQLEVVGCEPDDCISLVVGDDGVDLDEVDFGLEGRLRSLRVRPREHQQRQRADREHTPQTHDARSWVARPLGYAEISTHFHDSMTFR